MAKKALSQLWLWKAELLLFLGCSGRKHNLPCNLIVSLTSYPPRFPTLAFTLKTLLMQSVKPDRVILWICNVDYSQLSDDVLALKEKGLEIRTCSDLGPYKKIIPALKEFPDAFIATADDDINYTSDWLAKLAASWKGDNKNIICHRAHRIELGSDNLPRSYRDWTFDVPGPLETRGIMPIGAGGVLYPPGSLHPDVTDEKLFSRLSPKADDVWLYWMGRRNGAIYIKTPGKRILFDWPGSQDVGLFHNNWAGNENDRKIQAMIQYFGWPEFA